LRQASEKCKVIHCDVSLNNILLLGTGDGILNDWDMAKELEDLQRPQQERTDTWEFMSSLLVTNHHTVKTIQDDMESVVLVVLYCALRYFGHNRHKTVTFFLDVVFSQRVLLPDGNYLGGEARKGLFMYMHYIGRDFSLDSRPLDRWMRKAIAAVRQWIESERPPLPAREWIEFEHSPPSALVDSPSQLVESYDEGGFKVLPKVAPPAKQTRRLDSHAYLKRLFERCLSSEDWPEKDPPVDILLSKTAQTWKWATGHR
ncbi:hypothetical protein C0991_007666, partial [Blastosporella zonata]